MCRYQEGRPTDPTALEFVKSEIELLRVPAWAQRRDDYYEWDPQMDTYSRRRSGEKPEPVEKLPESDLCWRHMEDCGCPACERNREGERKDERTIPDEVLLELELYARSRPELGVLKRVISVYEGEPREYREWWVARNLARTYLTLTKGEDKRPLLEGQKTLLLSWLGMRPDEAARRA